MHEVYSNSLLLTFYILGTERVALYFSFHREAATSLPGLFS